MESLASRIVTQGTYYRMQPCHEDLLQGCFRHFASDILALHAAFLLFSLSCIIYNITYFAPVLSLEQYFILTSFWIGGLGKIRTHFIPVLHCASCWVKWMIIASRCLSQSALSRSGNSHQDRPWASDCPMHFCGFHFFQAKEGNFAPVYPEANKSIVTKTSGDFGSLWHVRNW